MCKRPKKKSMGQKATCPLHSKLEVQEITFSGNHIVEKDTLGNFGSPEWIKGRNANDQSPACYTRNKKVKIKAKFKVTTKPSQAETVKIKGSGIFDSKTLKWESDVNVTPSSNEITTSEMTSNTTLPDHVACYDSANITWQMNPANIGWSGAGTSSHLLYVTLGDPYGVSPHWTLLDISCRVAHGKKDAEKVVERIIESFKKSIGKGNGLKRKRDDNELKYWARGYETGNKNLLQGLPEGRCGNWSQFLLDMYRVHHITDGESIIMVRSQLDFHSRDTGFLVKEWDFSTPGTLSVPFTHKVLVECRMKHGIKAQGMDNSQPYFFDHVITKYKDQFFDPSYGVGPFKNLMDYEKKAFAGLGKELKISDSTGNPIQDFEGNKIYVPKDHCSKGFVEYTIKSGDTLSKISKMFGISNYKILFNHKYNESFRKDRTDPTKTRDPNLIYPGETIYIPFEIATKINMLKFYYVSAPTFGSEIEEKYRWH